jgi:hypothetical protein
MKSLDAAGASSRSHPTGAFWLKETARRSCFGTRKEGVINERSTANPISPNGPVMSAAVKTLTEFANF